jgi:hypothetical protein
MDVNELGAAKTLARLRLSNFEELQTIQLRRRCQILSAAK